MRLMTALRRLPAPVTAERLAQETEVSPRQLYRDIATLRAGGALIDGAAGYGYTLTEDPVLPPQSFSRIEIEALMLAIGSLEQLGDPSLARAGRNAVARIVATPVGSRHLSPASSPPCRRDSRGRPCTRSCGPGVRSTHARKSVSTWTWCGDPAGRRRACGSPTAICRSAGRRGKSGRSACPTARMRSCSSVFANSGRTTAFSTWCGSKICGRARSAFDRGGQTCCGPT